MSYKVVILCLCLGYTSARGTESFLQDKLVQEDDDDVVTEAIAMINLDTVEVDWPNNSCDVLAEINHLRTDPAGFSDLYLTPMLSHFEPYNHNGKNKWIYDSPWGRILKGEGPSAVRECIDVLNDPDLPEMLPLTYSDELGMAAKGMCEEQGPAGTTGHTGPTGSSMKDRIMPEFGYSTKAVVPGTSYAENIAYRFYTANQAILNLIIDDGVPNGGHRVNLLNPKWTHVGIGQGSHTGYDWMQVQNFGKGFDVQGSRVCPSGGGNTTRGGNFNTHPVEDEEPEVVGSGYYSNDYNNDVVDDALDDPSENGCDAEPIPAVNPVPIPCPDPEDWPKDAYSKSTNSGIECEGYESCTLTDTYTYKIRPAESNLKVIYENKQMGTYEEVIDLMYA